MVSCAYISEKEFSLVNILPCGWACTVAGREALMADLKQAVLWPCGVRMHKRTSPVLVTVVLYAGVSEPTANLPSLRGMYPPFLQGVMWGPLLPIPPLLNQLQDKCEPCPTAESLHRKRGGAEW